MWLMTLKRARHCKESFNTLVDHMRILRIPGCVISCIKNMGSRWQTLVAGGLVGTIKAIYRHCVQYLSTKAGGGDQANCIGKTCWDWPWCNGTTASSKFQEPLLQYWWHTKQVYDVSLPAQNWGICKDVMATSLTQYTLEYFISGVVLDI